MHCDGQLRRCGYRMAVAFAGEPVPPTTLRGLTTVRQVVRPACPSSAARRSSRLFPTLEDIPTAARDVNVGPVYFRPKVPLPQWIETRAKGRPLIYVGMGSSGSPTVLSDVLHQLGELPLDVLCAGTVPVAAQSSRGLTGRDLAGQASEFADNIHFEQMVPAHFLAGHIQGSIIHGGEGTVQAACLSGVPFAGIAMQGEQKWNLDGCVNFGNALRFTHRDVKRGRIPAIVLRLLSDRQLQRRSQVIRQHMLACDGTVRVVDEVERVLAVGH